MKKTKQNTFGQFLLSYSLMGILGIYICKFINKNIHTLGYSHITWSLKDIVLATLASTFIIAGLSFICESTFSSHRKLKANIFNTLQGLNIGQILIIAIVASFSEEIFFRAAIQPSLGILLTSTLTSLPYFATLLISPSLFFLVFTQNIILGVLYNSTKSLFPGITLLFILFSLNIYFRKKNQRKL